MQTTNKPYQSESSYYLLSAFKLAVFAFVILIAFSNQVRSQVFLSCENLTISPDDEVRIINSIGKPKDTIWLPVFLTNDSIMSGFSMLIHWDSSKIAPITIYDPIDDVFRLVTQLSGRFVQTDQSGIDTTTNFFAEISRNPFDSGAIIAGYNLGIPPPGESIQTTEPGSGVIFRMAFRLDSSMQHNDSGLVRFYEIQPQFFDTSTGEVIDLNCRRTELSVEYSNSGVPITIYPSTVDGYIVADSAPAPQIQEFAADPTTIIAGSSFRLSYLVENADSLLITGPGVSLFDSTIFSGSLILFPSSTSSYFLTAWNLFDSSKATVTVVVDTTQPPPPPPGDAPVISFPQGSFHVIEQAQTVTFSVTATDPNPGDIVELKANNIPANATFNTVVGSNSVTGNFSFTPDVTQEGTFVVQFVATDDGGASSTANASISVEALQFDRLFSSSAAGQDPIGGLKGTRDLVFPINMVTSQTVYGIQFDMFYDHRTIKIDSLVGTARIQDFTVSENIGIVPGEVRVLAFGLANDSVVADTTSSAVINVYLTIDTGAIPWTDYIIDLVNGFESVSPDPDFPSLEMVTEGGVVQVDKPGDVNLDKRIDVADLVNIVAYIIGNYGLSGRQFESADIIRNDTVNVFDLVGTLNTIFGIPVSPIPPPPATTEPATMSLSYQNLNPGQRDVMVVRSYLPEKIAAVELDIEFDPTVVLLGVPVLAADASEMTMQYKTTNGGKMKILMRFTNPFDSAQQLPVGNIDMLVIPMYAQRYVNTGDETQLKINSALLSTWNAASVAVDGISDDPLLPETFELFQNYPNPFNPSTTIEFTIGLSSDGSGAQVVGLDIFNILGQRVINLVDETLPSGHYSIEWNSRNFSGHRVSTGVYFYRLRVGSESETKKMLLIK
ncbi:MAG: T9SS type A sorting domain-containing protein [candidate division Zixibacteria bacterium]